MEENISECHSIHSDFENFKIKWSTENSNLFGTENLVPVIRDVRIFIQLSLVFGYDTIIQLIKALHIKVLIYVA